jgi:hypothetical protein
MFEFLFVFILLLCCGAVASVIAFKKGRAAAGWFFVGVSTSLLGVLVVLWAAALFPFNSTKDGFTENQLHQEALSSVTTAQTTTNSIASYLSNLKPSLSNIEQPYFWDIYDQDHVFRERFISATEKEGIEKPDWVPGGVASPVEEAENGFLKSSVCEPHNCAHSFFIEYSPESKHLVGVYRGDNGERIWFGDDLIEVKANLCLSYALDCIFRDGSIF